MNIKIVDYIGDRATDMGQGDKICNLIKQSFKNGKIVYLDFSGLNTVLSTFLNNAIGALYKDYDSVFLNKNLKIIGIDKDDYFILSRVTKRAKEYYSNTEKVTYSLNEDFSGE